MLFTTAYVGPYSPDSGSPESTVTKIQVLNVTPDASKTDDTDSDNEIPTLNCGMFLCCLMLAEAMKKSQV